MHLNHTDDIGYQTPYRIPLRVTLFFHINAQVAVSFETYGNHVHPVFLASPTCVELDPRKAGRKKYRGDAVPEGAVLALLNALLLVDV